jgi:hypothetical protein
MKMGLVLNKVKKRYLFVAFIKNDPPRLRKEIAANHHMPYGTATAFAEGIKNANMERMAKLVKIVGMLLQTKVYLFWSKDN